MPDKMDEMVAVLPRALFHQDFEFPGLATQPNHLSQLYMLMQQVEFKRRGDVETDESWLQVIPYMYIYDKNRDKVFVYHRSVKSGEKRLHGKATIGIGGHISESDCFLGKLALLGAAASRELHEEVSFKPVIPATGPAMVPVGVMLLDDSPVDRVHLGVVIRIEYEGEVTPNGDEVENYVWSYRSKLNRFDLENWSKVVAGWLR